MVKITIAARNTCRAPKWSATQPLAGMNTERLIRYEVSATLICSGGAWKLRAIAGSAVAITVESRFCINKAVAIITAISRMRPSDITGSASASTITRG